MENLLSFLLEEDQNNIKLFKSGQKNLEELKKTSIEISKKFIKIIEENNFPFKNTTSEEIYKAAIVLSLHLDLDSLKKIFFLVKDSSEEAFESRDRAYFIDKINVLENKKQIYGTQYTQGSDGNITFLPMEDEANIDTLRKSMNLCSLAEYVDLIKGDGIIK
jgi:hypothetical protein